MKASEMTNEELAKHIECGDAILREAAARLRRPTPVDDDLLKMARDIDAKNAEIAKLRTLTTHTDNSEVIAELQRRLAAVVKYAKDNTWDESGEKNAYLDTTTRIHNHDMRAILRAARGEGGAE